MKNKPPQYQRGSRRQDDVVAQAPTELSELEQPVTVVKKIRNDKRRRAYWDSIYTGQPSNLQGSHSWDFTTNKGPSQLMFEAQGLRDYMYGKNLKRFSCRDISFQGCDFEGDFKDMDVAFNGCKFKNCDFGETTWLEAKFSGCEFSNCSLTVTEFDLCQFYHCKWSGITVSGTETKFQRTLVSNPGEFIKSIYTNTDAKVLEEHHTNAAYQRMRLENTKSKIARLVHKGTKSYGDETAYYEGLRTKINQSINAAICEATYNFKGKKSRFKNSIKIIAGYLELLILNASGAINAWGKSIVRPTLLGLLIMIAFGLCYGAQLQNYKQGFIQGFDITFLVGYTKYAKLELPELTEGLYALNAFLGLWWYAILVPTLINRLSRD